MKKYPTFRGVRSPIKVKESTKSPFLSQCLGYHTWYFPLIKICLHEKNPPPLARLTSFGHIWPRLANFAPFGFVWPRLAHFGPIWSCLTPFGPPWPPLAPLGPLGPPRLALCGLVWSRLDPFGTLCPNLPNFALLGPTWPSWSCLAMLGHFSFSIAKLQTECVQKGKILLGSVINWWFKRWFPHRLILA